MRFAERILFFKNYIIFSSIMTAFFLSYYYNIFYSIALIFLIYWLRCVAIIGGACQSANCSSVFLIIYSILYYISNFYTVAIPFIENSFTNIIATISLVALIFFSSKNLIKEEDVLGINSPRIFSTFFLFWFFPVGIWFLQPRVNKVMRKKAVISAPNKK